MGERAAAHCWPCCFQLTMYQLHTARGPLPLATFPVSLASLGRWRGRRQAGQRRRRRQQRGVGALMGGETGGFADIMGGETGGLADVRGGATGGLSDITGRVVRCTCNGLLL